MTRKLRSACAHAAFELLDSRELFSADLGAANVLVLYNTASSDGAQIANYYAHIHPGVQLLGISGVDPNNEDISADAYLAVIRPQVLAALTPTIDVIVTTKGLPLRVNVQESEPAATLLNPIPSYVDPRGATHMIFSWRPTSSLESELTTIDTVSMWQQMGDQSFQVPGNPTHNPFFHQSGPFSHTAFGDRLTARLDGYTVSDVEASLDRAQNAFIGPNNNPSGPYWFIVDDDPSIHYAPTMASLVNNVLNPAGLPVVYDDTSAFVSTANGPVIGYDSHGVHQSSTPANYITSGLNITLANGAVFNSWESFNAITFSPSGDTKGQGQIAQWLQKGGTAGVGNVAEPFATPTYVANEDQLFAMLLSGRTFAEAAWSSIFQLSYVTTVVGDPLMTWKPLPSTSTVAGRYAFYNNSLWDGNNPAANSADDAAIAVDKTAYLPGSGDAGIANITSYSKGITGVMVDLQGGGNHAAITLANTQNDFSFRVGNNNSPGSWTTAPNPNAVIVRSAAGTNGSDRVELTWASGAIKNQWLEITVKAGADTGLTADDVFYFGNAMGNTGLSNTATVAKVGAADITGSQSHFATIIANISITDVYDFNKDGQVSAVDVAIAQTHTTSNATGLQLLNIAAPGPAAPMPPPIHLLAAVSAVQSDAVIASALSTSTPTTTSVASPSVLPWINHRLQSLDLRQGPAARYFEQLAHELQATSPANAIKVGQDLVSLSLHDELLTGFLGAFEPA